MLFFKNKNKKFVLIHGTAEEVREQLLKDGFSLSVVQNALWRASGNEVAVTCYKSLKLLVQGKNCDSFVEKYIKVFKKRICREVVVKSGNCGTFTNLHVTSG